MNAIEGRELHLSFGATPALRGASCRWPPGRSLAVMGPSGSGKSTLLHCLAGILVPDRGEVWFGGRRIDTLGETARSALRRGSLRVRVPVRPAGARADRGGERGPAAAAGRHAPARRRWPRPGRGSGGSAWTGWSSAGPASCPVVRPSGWRWPAAWWPSPRCCSRTSRPGRSTRSPASTSWSCWPQPPGSGHDGHPGHPRAAGGGLRRPRGHGARRPGRPRSDRLPGLPASPSRRDPPRAAADPGGGREAAIRLVVTAAAVALGVSLLLVALAGINAVNAQNGRYAWLGSGAAFAPRPQARPARRRPHDPMWWLLSADTFDGQLIGRVDVAATGPLRRSRRAIPRLPGPGQYYASPALTRLLRTTTGRELGRPVPRPPDRHHRSAALPARTPCSSSSGHTPAQLAHQPGATQVTSIRRSRPAAATAPHCVARGGHQRRRHRPDPVGGGGGAAVPGARSSSAPPPGCRRPAGSSGSPPCAWSARHRGRCR